MPAAFVPETTQVYISTDHLEVAQVKWPNGHIRAALRNGWRGCAIDLKLAVGDAVVFEVLPGRRGGRQALQMRIFRARDPHGIRPMSEVLAERAAELEAQGGGAEGVGPAPAENAQNIKKRRTASRNEGLKCVKRRFEQFLP